MAHQPDLAGRSWGDEPDWNRMAPTRRIADVNRSEVAGVSLLLAMLLSDLRRSIPAFLRLLERRSVGARGFDHVPLAVPAIPPALHWTRATVDIGHEFSIADDLVRAGMMTRAECLGQETPDLPLLLGYPSGNWSAVVIEAKYLYPWNLGSLNAAMRLQRDNAIALLPRIQPRLDHYRHIALLPRELVRGEVLDADGTICWADVAKLAVEVLGEDHIVTGDLQSLAARCVPAGPYLYVPTYDAMIELCHRERDAIEIGIQHGRDWLRTMSEKSLRSLRRPWKARPRSAELLRQWAPGNEVLRLRGII